MDFSDEPADFQRKGAREDRAVDEALEIGEEKRSNPRPPEDRQLLELLELQRRMFQSGCCE